MAFKKNMIQRLDFCEDVIVFNIRWDKGRVNSGTVEVEFSNEEVWRLEVLFSDNKWSLELFVEGETLHYSMVTFSR